MYERAESILLHLLSDTATLGSESEESRWENLAGITLVGPSRHVGGADIKAAGATDTALSPDIPAEADPSYAAAEADTCCGMSLFRDPDAPPVDWSAAEPDTAAGVTLFSLKPAARPATPPPPGPAGQSPAAPADGDGRTAPLASLAWAAVRGWWQDPAGYTEEQARLSDLAWGASA